MVYSHLRYSDKPFMGSVTAPERAEDTVSMAKIVFGDAFVDANAVITSLINANSPLVWDATMLGALKVYARNNQATIVSPFCIAGAMSPVTIAATCAQLFAEALSGMAFAQLVRPGAPVIFGTFSSSMSMQSGAPTFGTPEPQLVLNVIGSLARRLGVPVPQRRRPVRVQAARRPGRVRSREHAAARHAGRGELHAARGGVARRRGLRWATRSS